MNTHDTPVSSSLKFPRLVALVALALATGGLPALAQSHTPPGQQTERPSGQQSARTSPGQSNDRETSGRSHDENRIRSSNTNSGIDLSGASLAEDLRGREVHNAQNEKIGSISDFVIDLNSGRSPYVVIGSGGVLGMGATYRAVPAGALVPRALGGGGKEGFVLNISNDLWERVPTLKRERIGDLEDEVQGRNLHNIYGQPWIADDISPRDVAGVPNPNAPGMNPSDRGRKNPGESQDANQARAGRRADTQIGDTGTRDQIASDARSRADIDVSNRADIARNADARDGAQANSSSSASARQRGPKFVLAGDLEGKSLTSGAGDREIGSIEGVVIARDSSRAAILIDPSDKLVGDDHKYVVPFSRVTRVGDERYTADLSPGDFSPAAGTDAAGGDSAEVRRWPADQRFPSQAGAKPRKSGL